MSGRHEGACDGRATERAVGRIGDLGQLGVDRQTELAQERHRPHEPLAASGPLAGQHVLEVGVGGIHPEPEDVELAFPEAEVAGDDGVDLDTRDEGQSLRDRVDFDDLAVPGERVVVGQGDQADTDVGRRPEQHGGLQDAVGAGRVGVQVDRRGRGWLDPTRPGRRQRVVAAPPRPGRHVTPR